MKIRHGLDSPESGPKHYWSVWDHLDGEGIKRKPTSKEELQMLFKKPGEIFLKTAYRNYKRAHPRKFRLCWRIAEFMPNIDFQATKIVQTVVTEWLPWLQGSVSWHCLSLGVVNTANLHDWREWQERNRGYVCVCACVWTDRVGDLFKELSFNQPWQPFRDHLPFIWSTRLDPPVKLHSDRIMAPRQHSDSKKTQNQYFSGDTSYFRGSDSNRQ